MEGLLDDACLTERYQMRGRVDADHADTPWEEARESSRTGIGTYGLGIRVRDGSDLPIK